MEKKGEEGTIARTPPKGQEGGKKGMKGVCKGWGEGVMAKLLQRNGGHQVPEMK